MLNSNIHQKRCVHENGRVLSVQACDTCRQRKIRCIHAQEQQPPRHGIVSRKAKSIPPRSASRNISVKSDNLKPSRESKIVPQDSLSSSAASHSAGDQNRFIGDLNPESVFAESEKSNINQSGNRRIGIWVSEAQTQDPDNASLAKIKVG